MQATLVHTETVAPAIRAFWFKPQQSVRYIAGQFVELTLPHANPDDRGTRRWFTLSSSPSEDLVSITTKLAHPSSSFKNALFRLQPGEQLIMSEPMGDFVLPKKASIPLVFVAAGLGITPIRSMTKWLNDINEHRSTQLIYTAGNDQDFAYKDLFDRMPIETTYITRNSSATWHGATGRVSAKTILTIATTQPDTLFYLSGAEPTVERLYGELQHAGIKPHHLVTDYFHGYPEI
jgi:glycine betaine catabolism B